MGLPACPARVVAVLVLSKEAYAALAAAVLLLHLLFILWVVFGALLARYSLRLRRLHLVSLLWGIFIETAPWSCPLTVLENALESRAGVQPYQGGFLLHYLDAMVYPNIPAAMLTIIAVAVCGLNLSFYALRFGKNVWRS
jgi:hypothetical protein